MKAILPAIEMLESRIAPATFTVTSLADSGAGSRRDAIAQANAAAGADKIVFSGAAKTGTILVLSQLSITDDLTITGPGAGKLMLDGNTAVKLLDVNDSTAALKAVKISGLSFARGASAGGGGAISSSENLEVSKCVFIDNLAGGSGGAIAESTGSLVVKASTFIGNVGTTSAGAVFAGGSTAKIEGSKFLLNKSTNGAAGALLLQTTGGTAPSISASRFGGNTAGGDGGAVWLQHSGAGDAVVAKTIFEHNQAGSASGRGGGLFLNGGPVSLVAPVFAANRAELHGGGVMAFGNVALTVSGGSFTGNVADLVDGIGGAIESVRNGGSNPTLIIKGTVFAQNQAAYGGGVTGDVGTTASITGAKFLQNFATSYGGGLNLYDDATAVTSATVTGTLFSGNRVTELDGGGMIANVSGTLTVRGSKFTGNVAGNSGGGAVLISTGTKLVDKCQFTDNSTGLSGGGLYIDGAGTTKIAASVLKGNFSAERGGGLQVVGGAGAVEIAKVIVTGNIASQIGGGIRNGGATVTIDAASKVTGNLAPTDPDRSGV